MTGEANSIPREARATANRLRRLHQAVRFALPHRYAIGLIIGLTLSVAVINAFEPLVLKWIFDRLAVGGRLDVLVFGVAGLAGFASARELMDGVASWLTWRTRIGLQYTLLEATIGKLHRMPLRIQRSEGVGAIMTRLDRSIQGLTSAVSLILFNILPSLIFLVIVAAIMIDLERRLAVLVLVFAPLPAIIAAYAGTEQTLRERTLLDRWAKIYSRFNEVLSGILIVRSFAMEDAEKGRFLRDVAAANKVVVSGVATDTGYAAASNVIIALARMTGVGFGGYLVLHGQVTIGTVVAFLGYIGGLFGPVQGLSATYTSLRRASVSFGILNVQEHLGDSPDARDLDDVTGAVTFENVHFRYEQAERPLLDGVSLQVAPGERLAIVGPSGAGKTTLMALLMRFYDPMEGAPRRRSRPAHGQAELAATADRRRSPGSAAVQRHHPGQHYGRPEASDAEIRLRA